MNADTDTKSKSQIHQRTLEINVPSGQSGERVWPTQRQSPHLLGHNASEQNDDLVNINVLTGSGSQKKLEDLQAEPPVNYSDNIFEAEFQKRKAEREKAENEDPALKKEQREMLKEVKKNFKGIFDTNLIPSQPLEGDSIMDSVMGTELGGSASKRKPS